jgi:uncharacterized membrane protein YdjX (TVP38/TMEM64 family)
MRASAAVALALAVASCAGRLPTAQEANEAVLMLREYGAWAWALGIALIWVDLVLPVPQGAVIAALGIIYGAALGALLGTVGLVTGGLLGYALMRTSARHLVVRLVGLESLRRVQAFFERNGALAIVLTRSLPYSIPEAVVLAAGLARMPLGRFLVALGLGSVFTAAVFAAIGAGWSGQPLLALAASWVLPVALLPLVLFAMRRPARAGRWRRPGGS